MNLYGVTVQTRYRELRNLWELQHGLTCMGNTPPLVVVGTRGAKLRFNVL
jgi:hypothetical protein